MRGHTDGKSAAMSHARTSLAAESKQAVNNPARTIPGGARPAAQSSREIFSRRSWASWASTVRVAMGRAINRPRPIGSPVTSQ